MKIRKPLLFSAIALTTALVLTGCVPPSDEPVPTSAGTAPADPSEYPKPTEVPNLEDEVVSVDLADSGSELTEAQYLFPDANATDSFTKEEVQLALYSSFAYFQAALTTPYFLNGSYEAEGYPDDRLQQELKPYFSNTALADLIAKTSDRTTLLDIGKPAYQAWAQSIVYFPILDGGNRQEYISESCLAVNTTPSLPDDPNYQGTPGEATEVEQEIDPSLKCIAQPPVFTAVNYVERVNDSGETVLTVTSTGSVKNIIINNGQSGTQTVTYNFVVDVSPNEYADWKNGVHSMVISNWYDPKATWTAWQAE